MILVLIRKIQAASFNGIGTHDLYDAGAMLYQLSYEATQLGAGQVIGLMCSCESCLNFSDVYMRQLLIIIVLI